MRALRRIGVYVVLCAAAALIIGIAMPIEVPNGGRPRPWEERAQAAFDARLERAADVGIDREVEGESGISPVRVDQRFSRQLELPRGECLEVIAWAVGCARISDFSLSRRGRRVASSGGNAAPALRWCAMTEDEVIDVGLRFRRDESCNPEHASEGTLHWEVRRGLTGSVIANGGMPIDNREAHLTVERDESAVRFWLETQTGDRTHVGEPHRASFGAGIVLLPRSAATCHRAVEIFQRDLFVPYQPRVEDSAAVMCPPTGAPQRRSRPPVLRLDGQLRRVVAVVDVGALGAACVTVRLARMLPDHRAPGVIRLDPAGNQTTLEHSDAQFVSTDRHCPATGVFAYTVLANDREDYFVEVLAEPVPEGAVAEPAPDPTTPFPTVSTLSPELLAHEQSCSAGNVATCMQLGHTLRQGAGVRQDLYRARRAFERACSLRDGDACATVARMVQLAERVPANPHRALFLYTRASRMGSGLAFAHLGDLERLGEPPPGTFEPAMQSANRAYHRACELGIETACTNEQLMQTLRLLDGP